MTFRGVSKKMRFLLAAAWLGWALAGSACSSSDDGSNNGATGGTVDTNIAGQTGAGGVTGSVLTTTSGSTAAAVGGTTTIAAGGTGVTGGKSGTTTSNAGVGGTKTASNAGAAAGAGVQTPTAGAGGAAGTGGAAGAENPRTVHHAEDLGEGDGQDVVTIGDSWMNIATNFGGIEGGLDRVTGKTYRHRGFAATTVLSEQIPNQYETEKGLNPNIKTVIMTGGGNDIIMDATMSIACAATSGDLSNNACRRRLYNVAARLGQLWTEMSNDGVRDIVVINYAKGAATSVTDYIQTDVKAEYQRVIAAVAPPVVIHYIETEEIINGVNGVGGTGLIDGIHPTVQGCTDIAQAAYDHMKEAGARR